MNKNLKALLIASSVLATSIPTIASAGADSGFYIGGGVGDASVDIDAFDDKKTKGIILRMNTPGGSPVQSAYINDEIYRGKDYR